jgi:hypothetical protein
VCYHELLYWTSDGAYYTHWSRFPTSTEDWSIVFVDLFAAYDTVWRDGLMLKFMRTVPCAKISNLLNIICCQTASFKCSFFNQTNRWRRLNNGIPQGSVLAPILFNLYMLNLPSSSLNLFQYAENAKSILKKALKLWVDFFKQWRLRSNQKVCVFHSGTRNANRKLTVQFDNTLITHVDHPKYLGMDSGPNAFL